MARRFLTIEAKTRLPMAQRPFLATARMRLSESLLADARKPQRRLSDADCLSWDFM